MRKLIPFLLAAVAVCSAHPTLSNCNVVEKSHASATLRCDASGATGSTVFRLRAGTTASFDAGADPYVYAPGTGHSFTFMIFPMSGLKPNTLQYLCPQGSDDGVTWQYSSGVPCPSLTFTTDALPGTHPVKPTITNYIPTQPNTTGYATVTAADCTALQSAVNTAVSLRASTGQGTVITYSGTYCSRLDFATEPEARVVTFNTTTDKAALTAHGYSNGQEITFATSRIEGAGQYRWMPRASNLPYPATKMTPNRSYFVCNAAANDFQVGLDSGCGTILNLTSLVGPGSFTPTYYEEPWPRRNPSWIVIKPPSAESAYAPAGKRLEGAASKAASLWKLAKVGGDGMSAYGDDSGVFKLGVFTHHIWFQGCEFTHLPRVGANYADPVPTYSLGNYYEDATNIVFDRCWIHGQPPPDRMTRYFGLQGGRNVVFLNSQLDNFQYWRANVHPPYQDTVNRGLKASLVSQVVTKAAGIVSFGDKKCTMAQTTFTRTDAGTTSGTAFFEVLYDTCTMRLNLKTGSTATCTGSCSVITSGTPAYEMNAAGGYQNYQAGTMVVTSGTWGVPDDSPMAYNYSFIPEGIASVAGISVDGVGLINSSIHYRGGIPFHVDDLNGDGVDIGTCGTNFLLLNNEFVVEPEARPWHASYDGLQYIQRNGPEWKCGTNIRISGNRFEGHFAGKTSTGAGITLTARANLVDSDVEIDNNIFQDGCTAVTVSGGIPGGADYDAGSPPLRRFYFHNNLIYNTGALNYDPYQSATFFCYGLPLWMTSHMEDFTVEHNTDWRPNAPQVGAEIMQTSNHMLLEGMSFDSNLFLINGGGSGRFGFATADPMNPPNCSATVNKVMLDCILKAGATTSYDWANNFLVGGYANSETSTGQVTPATLATEYAGMPSTTIVAGATRADRIAALKYNDHLEMDFRLSDPTSPLIGAGTGGSDAGVQFDDLLDTSGYVREVAAFGGAGLLTATYTAPDTNACYIKIGSTYTTDAGGAVSRSTPVTGLSPGVVTGDVICYHAQTAADGYPLWLRSQFSATVTSAPVQAVNPFKGKTILTGKGAVN